MRACVLRGVQVSSIYYRNPNWRLIHNVDHDKNLVQSGTMSLEP